MEKAKLLSTIELPRSFTDVLYLTNREQAPSEVK